MPLLIRLNWRSGSHVRLFCTSGRVAPFLCSPAARAENHPSSLAAIQMAQISSLLRSDFVPRSHSSPLLGRRADLAPHYWPFERVRALSLRHFAGGCLSRSEDAVVRRGSGTDWLKARSVLQSIWATIPPSRTRSAVRCQLGT
jgi:hypothetical protein